MDYKLIAIEVVAIVAAYLMFMLPVASASDVDIMFNGNKFSKTTISSKDIVNVKVEVVHDSNDPSWKEVNIKVKVSSATLAHTVKKIFLYKCRDMDPTECVKLSPEEFDQYIETQILWSDMSKRVGTSIYPQSGNILLMANLEDENGKTTWQSLFTKITRTQYNLFDVHDYEVNGLEVHAKSQDLITPIKTFIDIYQMIPFNWLEKVVFKGSSELYALGGNDDDLSSQKFSASTPSGVEISKINKDFFFIYPKTTSGIASGVTLTRNPTFACGDGKCETPLGETQESCCMDCGCPREIYCDADPDTKLGDCRDPADIGIIIDSIDVPASLSSCGKPFLMNVTLKIDNAPATLSKDIQGRFTLGKEKYTVTCSGNGEYYNCPINVASPVSCGSGKFTISTNSVNTTLIFKDGSKPESVSVGKEMQDIDVEYKCDCAEGLYCDALAKTCQQESSMALVVMNVTTPITNFQGTGDTVELYAKVINPPSDLSVSSVQYVLGGLYQNNQMILNTTTGSPSCVGGYDTNHVYKCTLQVSVKDYDREQAYYFKDNSLQFTAEFSNGLQKMKKVLESRFADIIIPSSRCGDSELNPGETYDNCCVDAGCANPSTQFCDVSKLRCFEKDGLMLNVINVYPTTLHDFRKPHTVNINVEIKNAPSDLRFDSLTFQSNGEIKPWNPQCKETYQGSQNGFYDCTITVPSDPQRDEMLAVKNNKISMRISWMDGKTQRLTKDLEGVVSDFEVLPTFVCGDKICQEKLNEGDFCCLDCGCKSGEICSYDAYYDPNGTCLDTSNITLIIDSPVSPVVFKSCETRNEVKIQAHINNEPAGSKVVAYAAMLKGEDAQISCRGDYSDFGQNESFSCILSVPTIDDCSKGQSYVFDPNSISLLITYQSNERNPRMILKGDLPSITINQEIRTLKDIIDSAVRNMKERSKKILEISKQMLEWQKICLIALIISAVVSMTATIFAAFGGFGSGSSDDSSISKTESRKITSENTKLTAQTGQLVMDSIAKICELIGKYYEMMINYEKLEMEFVKMEVCLEVHQHNMDIGNCAGSLSIGCYTGMLGCLDMGSIDRFQAAMRQQVSETATISNQFGNNLVNIADNIASIMDNSNIDMDGFTFSVNSNRGENAVCGSQYKETNSGGSAVYTDRTEKFFFTNLGETCSTDKKLKYYAIVTPPTPGTGTAFIVKESQSELSSYFEAIKFNEIEKNGKYKIDVYCGKPANIDKETLIKTIYICYCKGTTDKGCGDSSGCENSFKECVDVVTSATGTPAGTGAGSGGSAASGSPRVLTLELVEDRSFRNYDESQNIIKNGLKVTVTSGSEIFSSVYIADKKSTSLGRTLSISNTRYSSTESAEIDTIYDVDEESRKTPNPLISDTTIKNRVFTFYDFRIDIKSNLNKYEKEILFSCEDLNGDKGVEISYKSEGVEGKQPFDNECVQIISPNDGLRKYSCDPDERLKVKVDNIICQYGCEDGKCREKAIRITLTKPTIELNCSQTLADVNYICPSVEVDVKCKTDETAKATIHKEEKIGSEKAEKIITLNHGGVDNYDTQPSNIEVKDAFCKKGYEESEKESKSFVAICKGTNELNYYENARSYISLISSSTDDGVIVVDKSSHCADNDNLVTYYCDDSKIKIENKKCENGCSTNKCNIGSPKITLACDPENYVCPSVKVNVECKSGETATATINNDVKTSSDKINLEIRPYISESTTPEGKTFNAQKIEIKDAFCKKDNVESERIQQTFTPSCKGTMKPGNIYQIARSYIMLGDLVVIDKTSSCYDPTTTLTSYYCDENQNIFAFEQICAYDCKNGACTNS